MAFEEDYDDIMANISSTERSCAAQKYKEVMTDFVSVEDFPHCTCSDKWVEVIQDEFEHMKRDYFIYDIEYICMNCEQSWIKRIHLIANDYQFRLSQMPTNMEEE